MGVRTQRTLRRRVVRAMLPVLGVMPLVGLAATAGPAHADHADSSDSDSDADTVSVEVLTDATGSVADVVQSLGGSVTGSVPGEVVQAEVPVDRVAELTTSDDVGEVRSPRLVTHPPVQPRLRTEIGPGFGPVVGQNVALTNAAAWHAAGIDGSVKIGLIDYFDLGLWNPVENGPIPDAAHRFCLDTSPDPELCRPENNDGINDGDGYEHGVAVAQVLRDIAPGAELFIASAGTVSDLQAAIDWFAANGVSIVNRSLGAAYDGPGDGSGPLAQVVDSAAAKGMVWFNSGGNDAVDGYARVVVGDLAATGGYVDFDSSSGVDTSLRINGECVTLDGIRWSDWDKPAAQRTDYVVEVWAPRSNPDLAYGENHNPADLTLVKVVDTRQADGAAPLEGADEALCVPNRFGFASGIAYIRIARRSGTSTVGAPDVLEVALGNGFLELGRSQAAYSAAKPVVDSRSPQLIAVGAINLTAAAAQTAPIAAYSSQGPTNDGRVKPDVSAPSCVANTLYPGCFNGTSAAAPAAAGMAALLLDARVALPGPPLAAAVRHFTIDRNAADASLTDDGPDNKYGAGQILLPSPPTASAPASPAAYQPLTPYRALDTRASSPVGPADLIGALAPHGVIDLTLAGTGQVPAGATAVAMNITSTDTTAASYIQAVPYLQAPIGSSSTLNIAVPGSVTPNFAIVPVGAGGKITIYSVPGGNLVVDVLGYFAPTGSVVAGGRFVAIDPVRTMDTRTTHLVPAGWSFHQPRGESVVVPRPAAVPGAGVSALVLNVTATDATAPGFLRAEPTGSVPATSTVNFVEGAPAANTVIVPLGANGTVSVFTSTGADIVVDVTGYITSGAAPPESTGRFVALATGRAYDSRDAPAGPISGGGIRSVQLTGLGAPAVPAGAAAVSINLTAADQVAPGFLTAFPTGGGLPDTSTLNYVADRPVANGALLKVSPSGMLDVFASTRSSAIVDVNGYFTG